MFTFFRRAVLLHIAVLAGCGGRTQTPASDVDAGSDAALDAPAEVNDPRCPAQWNDGMMCGMPCSPVGLSCGYPPGPNAQDGLACFQLPDAGTPTWLCGI